MTFKSDIKKGLKGEKQVIELLNSFGFTTSWAKDSKSSFFDLICDWGKVRFTIEVKNDLFAKKSGNIALEFFNPLSNKPSGLFVTKADLWAHIIEKEIYFANTQKLIQFTRDNEPCRTVYKVGDGNADLLLYNKDRLIDVVMFSLNKENFIDKLEELLYGSKSNTSKFKP